MHIRIGATVSLLILSITLIRANPAAEDTKLLPAEHRSGDFGGPPPGFLPPPHPQDQPLAPQPMPHGNDLWPLSRPDMPQIKNLNVLCEKNHMKVAIEFDRPFYGMIFSKGHFSDLPCVYLKPDSGVLAANFDVFLNNCGTGSSAGSLATYSQNPGNAFIENTIIVQYDPLVQEVWDQARKLRCTWYDYYEKTVTFKPFNVDSVQAVQANFLGDNIQCWMQIQAGKGPWANEVDGIVKIGQPMTMVLAIKDEENKFDMLVRSCVAHDGKRPPITLVDEFGCVVRTKVMSPFRKIQNFGASASVVSYAYFQAFKFPDSMNVFFQCIIQVCRHQCPEPACAGEDDFVDPRVAGAAATRNEVTIGAPSQATVKGHFPAQPPKGQVFPPPPPQQHQQIKVHPQLGGQGGQQQHQQPNMPPQAPVRVPYPLPLNQGYPSVDRDGVQAKNPGFAATGNSGRPRAADLNKMSNGTAPVPANLNTINRRQRRGVDAEGDAEKLAVPTTAKVIQVVAPGDVAFNLGTGNETVVIANSAFDLERSSICMTMPSFVAGLVILLLIMTVACLVASFLFVRMRAYNRKGGLAGRSTSLAADGYDNPEFVKTTAPIK